MNGKTRSFWFVYQGQRFPITEMFDVDGDETDDPKLAFTLVAMLTEDKWLASICSPHEIEEAKAN